MKIFVRKFDDVYGFVYMLAPKNNTVHQRLIWLPDHMQNELEVCHYEVSFEAETEDSATRRRWLDGLPELLINLIGERKHQNFEWPADDNVLKIVHQTNWEFELLIDVAKSLIADQADHGFDVRPKLECCIASKLDK